MELPPRLLEDCADKAERLARLARFAVMSEFGFPHTQNMRTRIARQELTSVGYTDQFIGSLKKVWVSHYGDLRGFDEAEIETIAVMLGVDEQIWPNNTSSPAGELVSGG